MAPTARHCSPFPAARNRPVRAGPQSKDATGHDWRTVLAALACGLACAAAGASEEQEAPSPAVAALAAADAQSVSGAADAREPMRNGGSAGLSLEVRRAPAPQFDADEGVPNGSRVDITGWTRPPSRAGLGLSLGLRVPDGAEPPAWAATGGGGSATDLGLRWRSGWDNNRRFDVLAWRRVSSDANPSAMRLIENRQPGYGTRVEMQFKGARFGRFSTELGALGMQLSGGARLSLRARHGRPMLYYRARF